MIKKQIELNEKKVDYNLRRSRKASLMRITVRREGDLILTLPIGWDEAAGEKFLRAKAQWILNQLAHMERLTTEPIPYRDKNHYADYRMAALLLAQKKVQQWNAVFGFKVNRVGIRNQKSRWGSCSWGGNLNFSYKILFLPERLQDYLVVHELCHLAELNHGRNFWQLVRKALPDYEELHRELRAKGPRYY